LSEPIAWLARPPTAFASLVVADVWKTTPFVTILLLAGLQSIPKDLYEAISIDGAGAVRRFFWITLPMLRPAIGLAVTFRVIHTLGIFDLVWILTGGGPANSTKTIAVYIYDLFFQFGELGYGAAVTIASAVGMFLLAGATGLWIRGRVRV
jgi:multiple sugar transport system permease protein